VLYQLPPSIVVSSHTTSQVNQHIVQHSDVKNSTLQQRFPQGTQIFLPQNHANITYMVVSNKDKMASSMHAGPSSPTVYTVAPSSSNIVSSPPALGVSQILANVTKTNLVTDIDSPNTNKQNNPNSVWVKRENSAGRYEYRSPEEMNRKNAHPSQTAAYQEGGNFPAVSPPGSQFDPMRPVVQTNEKGHQMHVHKVQHGNARVKYVEFKPVDDPKSPNHSPQPYNQFYQNTQQQQQHLTVQTQGQLPKSPLHSPPALRPPPALPPRSIALHSPPTLVPSPDVRPRFDYQKVRSPVQVTSFVNSKQHTVLKSSGNQAVHLPRLPIHNYTNSPTNGKPSAIQAFRSPPVVDGNGKLIQSSGKF